MQVYLPSGKRSVKRKREKESRPASYRLAQVRVARELQFGISRGSCRSVICLALPRRGIRSIEEVDRRSMDSWADTGHAMEKADNYTIGA